MPFNKTRRQFIYMRHNTFNSYLHYREREREEEKGTERQCEMKKKTREIKRMDECFSSSYNE